MTTRKYMLLAAVLVCVGVLGSCATKPTQQARHAAPGPAGGGAPPSAPDPGVAADWRAEKRVAFVYPGARGEYVVKAAIDEKRTLRLMLQIANEGDAAIYFLCSKRLYVHREQRTAYAVLGDRVGRYGDDLPLLQRLPTGASADCTAIAEVEFVAADLNYLEVNFFAMLEGVRGIDAQLQKLEIDAGWWDTSDLQLTEEFYSLLVEEGVSFSFSPLRE